MILANPRDSMATQIIGDAYTSGNRSLSRTGSEKPGPLTMYCRVRSTPSPGPQAERFDWRALAIIAFATVLGQPGW